MEPGTVIRWHREGLERFWNRKSRAGRCGGRGAALGREVIELIPNELAKLGVDVAVSTVARCMARTRKLASPSWRAFLGSHTAIVTEIVKASAWYPAESYHQDHLVKSPGHYLRPW